MIGAQGGEGKRVEVISEKGGISWRGNVKHNLKIRIDILPYNLQKKIPLLKLKASING